MLLHTQRVGLILEKMLTQMMLIFTLNLVGLLGLGVLRLPGRIFSLIILGA